MLKNNLIIILSILICLVGNIFGLKDAPAPEAKEYAISGSGSVEIGNGKVAVHDPSVMQDKYGKYYAFGTHLCAASSEDMISWKNVASGICDENPLLYVEGRTLRQTLSEPLAWTDAYQTLNNADESSWQTNIWAPTVIYNETMGKYCLYGSCSVWGTSTSVIWLATSDSIEGPFKYEKAFLYSGFNNKTQYKDYIRTDSMHWSFTNMDELFRKGIFTDKEMKNAPWYNADGSYNQDVYPNCIDPALFYDADGQLWLSYGSYFGGTYIMPMDEGTGLPDYEYMKNTEGFDMYFGKKIVATTAANAYSGEGVFVTYDKEIGYYYLFISYGGLNALGGYNIREYRSKTPDGPYLDKAGSSATDPVNSGIKLMGSYKFDCNEKAYLAAGHSSCIINSDGSILQVYHTRQNNGHDGYKMRVHQMLRTEDGWLTMLPFEYTGEKTGKTYTAEEIAGDYEFIAHGTDTVSVQSWDRVNDLIHPTQHITLNADGSISGLYLYGSDRNDATVSKKKVSGSWEMTEGTAFITLTVDSKVYEGVICEQADEAGNPRTVFSAIGENNETVWGAKG